MTSIYETTRAKKQRNSIQLTQLKRNCCYCDDLKTTNCTDVLDCIKHNHKNFKPREDKSSTARQGLVGVRKFK